MPTIRLYAKVIKSLKARFGAEPNRAHSSTKKASEAQAD